MKFAKRRDIAHGCCWLYIKSGWLTNRTCEQVVHQIEKPGGGNLATRRTYRSVPQRLGARYAYAHAYSPASFFSRYAMPRREEFIRNLRRLRLMRCISASINIKMQRAE